MQIEGRTGWRGSRNQGASETTERIAAGLGWFSIGLGLAEVIAPSRVAQLIGARDEDRTRNLLRLYGIREIAAGVGILSQPQPAGWMWSRVGGDLLDLATLGAAMQTGDADRRRLSAATAAVAGVTALDFLCAQQLARSSQGARRDGPIHASKSIMINRSPEEVYRFWRDFQNLPTFMSHLESVEVAADRHSHWRVKAPAGMKVEWDAELIEDRPNELIAWRGVEQADVPNSGHVRFQRGPGGRGTLVSVEIQYAPPGGRIGAMVAKLFGEEPGQQLDDDLRALKQVLETGDVVKSDASIHRWPHPAQPAARRDQLAGAH